MNRISALVRPHPTPPILDYKDMTSTPREGYFDTAHARAMVICICRVVGARLDRDRDRLLEFFVGVVLLRVAAAVYSFTDLLVAVAPVVMLASRVTIANF